MFTKDVLKYFVVESADIESNDALLQQCMADGDLSPIIDKVAASGQRWDKLEQVIADDARQSNTGAWAAYYAVHVLHGRWPEMESAILGDFSDAWDYLEGAYQDFWPEFNGRYLNKLSTTDIIKYMSFVGYNKELAIAAEDAIKSTNDSYALRNYLRKQREDDVTPPDDDDIPRGFAGNKRM